MSQFSTRNPYLMGKEAYADGLGPTEMPGAFTAEDQRDFRRGWIAAKQAADNPEYNHGMAEFFNIMFGGTK